jgi:Peptidase family M1 domain
VFSFHMKIAFRRKCHGKIFAFCIALILLFSTNLFAACHAETPQQLIDLIEESISKKDVETFSCLFGVDKGRDWLKASIERESQPKFEIGKIIKSGADKAIILLTGITTARNSGDDTYSGRNFSGLYEAEKTSEGWKVTKALAHKENTVKSQVLNVEVVPGKKLIVKDVLAIELQNDLGFGATLNYKAKITKVTLDGKKTEYEFGGGLLWVNGKKKSSKLLIEYELPEMDANDKNTNTGFWGNDFGHVRNQFAWHPLYDFSNPKGLSAFEIIARIPKEFHVVTTLPQTEKVEGDYRIVTAKSIENTPALGIFYDKNWKLTTKKYSDMQLDIFADSIFLPAVDKVQQEFYEMYQELETRFGKPISKYFNVVQDRSRQAGWLYLTNQTITAGISAQGMSFNVENFVRAPFHHEISHCWTSPIGPGSNFLREGWASFAETYVIRKKYGEEAEKRYLENYRKFYETNQYDNNVSILTDFNNGGVSYHKGIWIFKMLRDFVGEKSFEAGMRKYIDESRRGRGDIKTFVSSFAVASPKAVEEFLNPWLSEKTLPNLSAKIVDGKIEIAQHGTIFLLPVEIEFETNSGKLRKIFQINKPLEAFDLKETGLTSLKIDPDNQLMLMRSGE